MDGSSDVERNFSQMQLLECRRARRHHSEQVLQDLLKVRLHVPDEFRDPCRDAALSKGMVTFLRRAQTNYGKLFGLRRLASRSMVPVEKEDKLALLLWRRPRWQHLAHKKKGAPRTRAARLQTWESSVQRLVGERRLVAKEDSFVAHAEVEGDSLLEHMSQVLQTKTLQHKLAQEEAERVGKLTPPPAPVRKIALFTPTARKCKLAFGLKRKLVGPKLAEHDVEKPPAGKRKLVGPKLAEHKVEKPPRPKRKGTDYVALLDGARFAENVHVHFSAAAAGKYKEAAVYLAKRGVVGVVQVGTELLSSRKLRELSYRIQKLQVGSGSFRRGSRSSRADPRPNPPRTEPGS